MNGSYAEMSPVITATHCNTLQHTAAHCNTLQHTASPIMKDSSAEMSPVMNDRLLRGKLPARKADETASPALKRSEPQERK